MEINNKKNYLSHIFIFFILFLFAASLTMNGLFCSNSYLYELTAKTTEANMWAISENLLTSEDSDDTAHFKASFLTQDNSPTETITKNVCLISMIAAIPKGFSLLPFLILVFLHFFSTLFRLLPDEWTLVNQKVRLDD